MGETLGRVHSVESFGSADGPGVRYIVFLKGCNMRCKYCHNPDTWAGCGENDGAKLMTPQEVLKTAMRYKAYWKQTGGITVSGGEALLQIDFVTELFKLAKEGYFDGTLFHRVIKDFMIQGGDPDSKGAPKGKMLGTGGPDYTIPAEFVYPQLFHKRGALSAARLGDEVNPERESSGSQFYIVWGKTYKQNELKQMGMQMEQNIFNQLAKEHHDEIMNFRRSRDREGLMKLQDELVDETKKRCREQGYPKFTEEQQKAYTEVGGTPFLDNQYTVFGEVEEGLDVVEKIQNCETMRGDRPKEDISMEISIIEE